MDHPLTLTAEQLEAILDAAQTQGIFAGASGNIIQQATYGVNQELASSKIQGPCVIMDISDPVGMNPGHLAGTLNGYGNDLTSIAEESKKTRQALEFGFQQVVQKLEDIKNSSHYVPDYTTELRQLIVAVQTVVDAGTVTSILNGPTPSAALPPQVNVAADRIIDLLNRRPELRDAVKERMNGH